MDVFDHILCLWVSFWVFTKHYLRVLYVQLSLPLQLLFCHQAYKHSHPCIIGLWWLLLWAIRDYPLSKCLRSRMSFWDTRQPEAGLWSPSCSTLSGQSYLARDLETEAEEIANVYPFWRAKELRLCLPSFRCWRLCLLLEGIIRYARALGYTYVFSSPSIAQEKNWKRNAPFYRCFDNKKEWKATISI